MSAARHRLRAAAERVVALTMSRPARLGSTRLVCIDGPAGSGKSSLGAEVGSVASGHGTTTLVHLDDLLDGWRGLFDVADSLSRLVLAPLAEGQPGRYRRYDWELGRFAENHDVPPVDVLVVEGVAAGSRALAACTTTLVWVEAPAELRLARGLARDGEGLRPQWERFMVDEQVLFEREQPRRRADVVVDGSGSTDAVVVR